MAVGSGSALQAGKESAWGTAVAATFPINFTSESIGVKVEKKADESLLASKAAMASDLMRLTADGSFNFVLRPEFAGQLFKMSLGGTDTVTTNEGGVTGYFKHTIKLADANGSFPSYTFFVDRKVAVKKYSGGKVDSLDLECRAGDYVKGSVSIKAKDEASGSLTGGLTFAKSSFKTIGASLVVGGTTYDVNSTTFRLANNLQDQDQTYGLGIYNPEPLHSTREITLEFDIPYATAIDTLKDSYLITNDLVASGVLTLLSPSMVTGISPYKVVITMNNLSITDVSYNVSSSGVISAKVSAKALAIGSTEPLTVDVYDATNTAY